MRFVRVLTPVIGAALVFWGYYTGQSVPFVIGGGLCVFHALIEMGIDILAFPIVPSVFGLVGYWFFAPWYTGVAVGLAAWCVLDAVIKLGGGVRPSYRD